MRVIRHPRLASDIRETALHYAGVSERTLLAFWSELDVIWLPSNGTQELTILIPAACVEPILSDTYHLLYEVDEDAVFLVVLTHDRRHPEYGLKRRIQ